MFSLHILRNTVALWLIRRGLDMLSSPSWAIGAIALPTQSPELLAGHIFIAAASKESDQALSAASLGLLDLLCAIASEKVTLSDLHPLFSPQRQDPASDGLPEATLLH